MGIPAPETIDMEIKPRCLCQGAPEMFGQFDGEVTDCLSRSLHLINKIEAARQIDYGTTERLIHWHDRLAVARDTCFVTQRLVQGLPETDRYVFDRMMVVNLKITMTSHLQIK